jgi:hypothetical protein
MVRIIVTTEESDPVLLDEHVGLEHLSEGHAATQLVERLRWAVTDAEAVERLQAERRQHRYLGDRRLQHDHLEDGHLEDDRHGGGQLEDDHPRNGHLEGGHVEWAPD